MKSDMESFMVKNGKHFMVLQTLCKSHPIVIWFLCWKKVSLHRVRMFLLGYERLCEVLPKFDWPITFEKHEAMKIPQNTRFDFEVQSSSPLAHVYRWSGDKFCQSIWDKSEMLLGTLCCNPPPRGKKKLAWKVHCLLSKWKMNNGLSTFHT
jgi:hypothetical protein